MHFESVCVGPQTYIYDFTLTLHRFPTAGLSAMSVGKQKAPNAERDLFLCATYHTDKVKIGGKGE